MPTATPEESERARSVAGVPETPATPGNRTNDRSLPCRLFGICRDENGRTVLDPTAGGTVRPGGILQFGGTAQEWVLRGGAIGLGAVFIVMGLYLSRGNSVTTLASAVANR